MYPLFGYVVVQQPTNNYNISLQNFSGKNLFSKFVFPRNNDLINNYLEKVRMLNQSNSLFKSRVVLKETFCFLFGHKL